MAVVKKNFFSKGLSKSAAFSLFSRVCRWAFLSVFSLTLLAASSNAQVIPGSVAPERAEQRFREMPPQQVVPPSKPTIAVPETPVTGRLAERFTLKSVQVDGSTVYPSGTFDSVWNGQVGKTIMLADAREMARAVTTRYRTDGYVLSQAVIPKQDLSTGVLHIRIVEGFIDKVYIENDRPASDRRHLIDAYAQKIRGVRPLNTKTLERYMLLIDDLPGVTARAIIRPSPNTFGAADLVVQVKNKIIDASFTSDNRGNKFLGPYQEQLTLSENSAAGIGERTTVRGINTIPWRDLHFFDVQNEEQIGHEGTKLIFLAAFAHTHPGDDLKPLDLSGTSDDYSITITHPFIRSRAQNFTGRLTFDARDSDNNALGQRINNDRVRAFRLGGNYDTGDAYGGVDQADASVSQGINGLGSTGDGSTDINDDDNRSRLDGREDFTKFNLDVSRIQSLPYGFSLLVAGSGQYSPDRLMVSEQYSLGGVGFGQAYDSGELSGDSAVAGKVELRYGQPVGRAWFDSYQLYTYYDVGTVFFNDALAGVQDQFSLASVGVGSRVNFNPNLYGYVEVGFPLTRNVASENDTDPRFFFSITARY